MFRRDVILAAYAILVHLTCCVVQGYSGYFDMFDRCEGHYGTVLMAYNATSVERCLAICLRNSECFSVTFDPIIGTCVTNAGKTTHFPTGCTRTLIYLSLKKSPYRSVLYGECASATDCTTANSRCYNGTCECLWEYSYNPANVACVEDCEKYGTTFSIVPDYYLDGHNDLKLVDISLDMCRARCLTITTFTCRSFDYDILRNRCNISKDTALKYKLRLNPGKSLYVQRKCE